MVGSGMHDTIYALSSGALPAGIAMVRISGPSAENILTSFTGRAAIPNVAQLATLRANGKVLDRALTLFFPEGQSFTGEAVTELHLHGGRAVLQAVFKAIAAFSDTRPAERGEFTRRAFVNGRVDLTAAEGVADLIAAETESQRRLALGNAAGQQKTLYQSWRQRLIEARALIEADLDFSDEGDVPGSVADTVLEQVSLLREEIEDHLSNAHRAEIVRDGFHVVILGEPNVGKSSLLNALARRDVAIVSDEAGTTRDLIEVALDLDGYKVVFTDTAGLRETQNQVEQIGIGRARDAARHADLVLLLHVAGKPHPLTDDEHAVSLSVATKTDLIGDATTEGAQFAVSTRNGDGIATLLSAIAHLAGDAAGATSLVLPTQERHLHLLQRTVASLLRAERDALPLELRAEELRVAADELGRITGLMGVEDLLDVIFSRFCIGK
jgi:tRNA modification GTPase